MANYEIMQVAEKISKGDWHGFRQFPEDMLVLGAELFCHAALLAKDSTQALAFMEWFCERMFGNVSPDVGALLLHVRKRLETMQRKGGWMPVEVPFDVPHSIDNPFPMGVFPSFLERFCDSVAANVQVDRAMISAAVLAASALSMQGKFMVTHPSGNGHAEHLCLYIVIVASPGERKSAVFSRALAPIRNWQRDRRGMYRTEMAEFRAKSDAIRTEIEMVKGKLHKANAQDRRTLGDDLSALYLSEEALQRPDSPELIAMDTTAEALAALLELTGGTAGIFTDEADFFKIIAGLYNRGQATNLGLILKAYDGSAFHRTRRMETVVLERPLLSMCLFAQPVLFEQAQGNGDLQGRGMIGRLLCCSPSPMAGRRDVRVNVPVDADAEEEYSSVLGDFLNMGQVPEERLERLQWEQDAAVLMLSYLQKLEDSMQKGHSMEQAADYASKAGGAAIRIAAILHLLHSRGESFTIPLHIAKKAVRLHRYFFGEKVREMHAAEQVDESLLRIVREKIEEMTIRKEQSFVSVSALQQKLRWRKDFSSSKKLWCFLHILEGRNQIAIVETEKNKKMLFVSPYWELLENPQEDASV